MRPVVTWSLAIAGLLVCSGSSFAGNNAGGTAYLSWDRAGTVSAIQVPQTDPFPLYLRIHGTPDIRSLAVNLSWMPADTNACHYHPLSSAQDDSCGATTDTPPDGGFEGDSSYTWSIGFAALDTAKDCVAYSFSRAPCDTAPPGKFIIGSILALDSNGQVDSLEVAGAAKIMGESGVGPPDLIKHLERDATGPTQLIVKLRPNPANTSITFDLVVPTSGPLRIGIYDLAGRRLRDLVHEPVSRGNRTYAWNLTTDRGERVRSGIYFARVTAAGGMRLVPAIVVK